MGRVIKYSDRVGRGRKVSPTVESPSMAAAELQQAKRGENIRDAVRAWTGEDLNLYKPLLLDLMEKEKK